MNKLLVVFLFWNLSVLNAQVFPVQAIHYSGSPNEHLNVVIMGDGYTANQQTKFLNDAQNAINGFLNQEPFSTYKDSINVFAVLVESNAEGASMDPNNLIDNYFGSSYWCYGMERLLCISHYTKAIEVLNENTPFYDEAVIIVNHTKYGGSGGQFAVFSAHSEAVELLLHEFGHSFAFLADEYWAGAQYASEKANMTQDSNPATNKWRQFIGVNEVGIYPHSESPDWFRPHQNCKMRYLGSSFCEVCKDKIKTDLEFIANSDSVGSPLAYFSADKLQVLIDNQVVFNDFSTNRPKTWKWTFEGGDPSYSEEQNPVVRYAEEGTFSVKLEIENEYGSDECVKQNYIHVAKTLGVNDFDLSGQIELFPNPAEHFLIVRNHSPFSIVTYKIMLPSGKTVASGRNTEYIDVQHLPAGFYLLCLNFGERNFTTKFIKR